MKGWLQRTFINLLVHHLFNFVTEDDVLTMRGQNVYFQGRKLDKETVMKIRVDAKQWKNSLLWQILDTEGRWQANKRMFEKSQTIEDILAGKIMLSYHEDVIKRKLDQLSN